MTFAALTPGDLSQALGIDVTVLSEWVRQGRLPSVASTGGERRIYVADALQFIRRNRLEIRDPWALGLQPSGRPPLEENVGDTEVVHRALMDADSRWVGEILFGWYATGRALADIYDGPVRAALYEIGELWQKDLRGIGVEHRASEACLRALQRLEEMIKTPVTDAPLAVGGALQGDPYSIPNFMAGTVLSDAGFQIINFGCNTPGRVLLRAATENQAKLTWVSVSSQLLEPIEIYDQLKFLARQLAARRIELIVGGTRLEQNPGLVPEGATFLWSMADLKEHVASKIKGHS
jgi:methanogenic corrinoid protein MtbC1